MCANDSKPLPPLKGYSSDFTISSSSQFPLPSAVFCHWLKKTDAILLLYNTKEWVSEWVTEESDSRVCFGVWEPDDCVIIRNICQIHVSSPLQFPLHSYTPQLVCVRVGSHTLHLLHPEAAPLMGVPSIVVLLLVHNLQEWLESFLFGVEKLRDQTRENSFV